MLCPLMLEVCCIDAKIHFCLLNSLLDAGEWVGEIIRLVGTRHTISNKY